MTASLGFDKPLYILAFDHRDLLLAKSLSEDMLDMLSADQRAEIESARSELLQAKHLVYDSFESALAAGVTKDTACVLVDERFGAAILGEAKAQGYQIACPAERSGQEEFDFEYGDDFAKHIEAIRPTFCKVQVRYNPEGDQVLNLRQSARLKRLSDYLHNESSSLFLLELLVPPERAQLKELKGDKTATYEVEIRPRLKVEAIQQLQEAQVEPDVWGVEGLDGREDCEKVVAAARDSGRDKVSCIMVCEGRDHKKVSESLKTAAEVPGFIGFAAGRTIFSDPLTRWTGRKFTAQAAAAEMSKRYQEFVNIFEKDRYNRVS